MILGLKDQQEIQALLEILDLLETLALLVKLVLLGKQVLLVLKEKLVLKGRRVLKEKQAHKVRLARLDPKARLGRLVRQARKAKLVLRDLGIYLGESIAARMRSITLAMLSLTREVLMSATQVLGFREFLPIALSSGKLLPT